MDYKVIVERREVDGSNYTVNRGEIPISSATVKLEGSRAVDSGQFIIRSGHDIKTGDTISFISDDLPVDNLACAYNFHHNLRDEGGYNIDGFRIDGTSSGNNITTKSPIYDIEGEATSKYRGHHCLDCTAEGQVIRFKQSDREKNKDRINLEGGREIHIHIRTPAESAFSNSADEEQVIFSRMDTNGGFQISLKHDLSENKIYAVLKSRAKLSSTIQESTIGFGGSNCLTAGYEKDCFIRVWTADRADPTNLTDQSKYKATQIQVDNKEESHYTYHSDALFKFEQSDVTKDIYLGADSSSQNLFRGKIFAVRVYNREFNNLLKGWDGDSGDEHHLKIETRLLPLSTMKFGGIVADVTTSSGKTIINAVGHSGIFLNTEVTADMFTVGTSNPDNTSHYGGVYNYNSRASYIPNTSIPHRTSTLLNLILDDIILNYNTNRLDSTGKGADWTDTSTEDQRCHLGKDIPFEFQYINLTSNGALVNDEDDITIGDPDSQGLGYALLSDDNVRNITRYDAGGRLIDTVRLLATLGNKQFKVVESGGNPTDQLKTPSELVHLYGADQFQMLPRKVLVFESSEIPNQTYFSTNNGYRIENEGYDDSSDVNQVQVFSDIKPRVKSYTGMSEQTAYTYPDNGGVDGTFNIYSLFATQGAFTNVHFISLEKIERIPSGAGATVVEMERWVEGSIPADGYKIEGGLITWGSNFDEDDAATEIRFYFNVTDYAGDDGYFGIKNDELIEKNGLKSKKYIVPQILDLTTLTALAKRILGAKAFPNKKVILVVPRMLNALGIGMTTTLDHGNIGMYNEQFVVKKITYNFPKGNTVVECGDFAYDVMDDISDMNEHLSTFRNEVTDTT